MGPATPFQCSFSALSGFWYWAGALCRRIECDGWCPFCRVDTPPLHPKSPLMIPSASCTDDCLCGAFASYRGLHRQLGAVPKGLQIARWTVHAFNIFVYFTLSFWFEFTGSCIDVGADSRVCWRSFATGSGSQKVSEYDKCTCIRWIRSRSDYSSVSLR
jgi:hypothetical protein